MAESHLISQLTKLIESSYKEKAILEHQLDQLKQQKSDLEDKILCFENTLIYIEPNFDLICTFRCRSLFDLNVLL